MAKTRSISIYLLKTGYDHTNAWAVDDKGISAETKVKSDFEAKELPPKSRLFVLDNPKNDPWWKGYFQINDPKKVIKNENKSCLVFVEVDDSIFVLCFGSVAHLLDDNAYEHDFGIITTLNSVDSKKLKSTDLFDPSSTMRRRMQIPSVAELNIFDFDRDSNILSKLAGKTKDRFKDKFGTVTGSSSLRLTTSKPPKDLPDILKDLKGAYESKDYLEDFPGMNNIVSVKDPLIIESLNKIATEKIINEDDDVYICSIEIENYDDAIFYKFGGLGVSDVYTYVGIDEYIEYMKSRGFDPKELTYDKLKKHKLIICDDNGETKKSFSLIKSLVMSVNVGGQDYHLSSGNWYEVNSNFIYNVQSRIDKVFKDPNLPAYTHDRESEYNKYVPTVLNHFGCLDQKDLTPKGYTQIEPCDLITFDGNKANLVHVKISTSSSTLSHLFNQAVNSIQLLITGEEFVDKLSNVLDDENVPNADKLKECFSENGYLIWIVIVTHKDLKARSANLPLFSQISLYRAVNELSSMQIEHYVGFVENKVPKKKAASGGGKGRKKAAP